MSALQSITHKATLLLSSDLTSRGKPCRTAFKMLHPHQSLLRLWSEPVIYMHSTYCPLLKLPSPHPPFLTINQDEVNVFDFCHGGLAKY